MVCQTRHPQNRLVGSLQKRGSFPYKRAIKNPTGCGWVLCIDEKTVRLAGFSQFHVHTAATFVKVDIALNTRVDGVVLAHEYIVTGVPLGATLANDDVSGDDFFAAELFDAKALAA